MHRSRRAHSSGVRTDDLLDALMILVAIVVLLGEVVAISTPFR